MRFLKNISRKTKKVITEPFILHFFVCDWTAVDPRSHGGDGPGPGQKKISHALFSILAPYLLFTSGPAHCQLFLSIMCHVTMSKVYSVYVLVTKCFE